MGFVTCYQVQTDRLTLKLGADKRSGYLCEYWP